MGPPKKAGCRNDETCNGGEFCNLATRTCERIQITGCSNDDACPPNQKCNTLTGVCIVGRRSCTSETQCAGIGKHCDLPRQQCVDCNQTADCTSPMVCVQNQCMAPTPSGCSTDSSCTAPAVCHAQQCVAGCQVPGSPIACGLGEMCDGRTGHCAPRQTICADDRACSAPSSICVSGQCVPGCGQPGGLQCTGSNRCNTATGRCESGPMCTDDRGCTAPEVCESARCVPGCGQPGGLQCTGGVMCSAATGRCVAGPAPCSSDTACRPPSTICDRPSGACVAGCGSSGCVAPQVCSGTTGRCEMPPPPPPPPPPMGQPLNASCNTNSECESNVCFDFSGMIGKRCVSSCGASTDCPTSFTCYDLTGGKMCVSAQLFMGSPTFATANGQSCTRGDQCHSNLCMSNRCVDTCSDSRDCGAGSCRWYSFAPDQYIGSCNGPAGSGANGARCTADTGCRSGVCYGSGTCGDMCGTSAQCPANNVCSPVNYSVCAFQLGACLVWQPNYVKACVRPASGPGAGTVGAACSAGNQCRSGLCDRSTNACTDTCARNAHCPSTHVCGIGNWDQLSDGTQIHVNVCRPREM